MQMAFKPLLVELTPSIGVLPSTAVPTHGPSSSAPAPRTPPVKAAFIVFVRIGDINYLSILSLTRCDCVSTILMIALYHEISMINDPLSSSLCILLQSKNY